MKIKHLEIDYLGLRLNELSPGLTIAYGGSKSGKTTIARFINYVLFGASESADYLIPDLERTAGVLGVDSSWGRFDLERTSDGSPRGMLSVSPAPREYTAEQWLRRLTSAVESTEFARTFTVEFPRRHALDQLVDQAVLLGVDAELTESRRQQLHDLLHQLEVAESRERSLQVRLAETRERRHRLSDEIAQLEQTITRHREVSVARRAAAREDLARAEREEATRRESLLQAESEIERLERESADYEAELRRRNQGVAESIRELNRFIDERIAQLRQAETHLETRIAHLRDELASPRLAPLEALFDQAHDYVDSLESTAARIDRDLLMTHHWEQIGEETRRSVESRLQAASNELVQLADDVRQTEGELRREVVESELNRTEGKRREVLRQISRLAEHRDELQRSLDALTGVYHRDWLTSAGYRERMAALRLRREEILAQLRIDQAALAAARHALALLGDDRYEREVRQLEEARAALAAVEVEWDRLHRERNELSTVEELRRRIETLRSARTETEIVSQANEHLRRLSDGELRRVCLDRQPVSLRIEDCHGKMCTPELLSAAGRDQVKLSLCLALADDFARRAAPLPLVLDDVLVHFENQARRAAVELIREYAAGGKQVLLLTSQKDIGHLFKSMGERVLHLPPRYAEYSRSHVVSSRRRLWECEELGGDVRDRLHAETITQSISRSSVDYHEPAPRRSTPLPEPVSATLPLVRTSYDVQPLFDEHHREVRLASGHYLARSCRIAEAVFLEPSLARQLDSLGVHTIDDLLRSDADELVARLVRPGMRRSTVVQWQAIARLMCEVRGLRAYDARILYQCGVTSPQQLRNMRPADLHAVVAAFVATPEGSRLVRSGNDFEMSRITRWIHAALADEENSAPMVRTRVINRETVNEHTSHTTAHSSNGSGNGSGRSSNGSGDGSRAANGSSGASYSANGSGNGSHGARTNGSSSSRSSSQQGGSAASRTTGSAATSSSKSTKTVQTTERRFFLEESSDVEAAPSIGQRTADRFYKIGIRTVADLLSADAEVVATRLKQRRIKGDVIEQWQQQASLVCRVPELRGHDAQFLVACGITEPGDLAAMRPQDVFALVSTVCDTKEGERILRGGKRPDLAEVSDWIAFAREAREHTTAVA